MGQLMIGGQFVGRCCLLRNLEAPKTLAALLDEAENRARSEGSLTAGKLVKTLGAKMGYA